MSDAQTPTPDGIGEERLDELVRRACRGEVDRQALDRLATTWHHEMRRVPRVQTWLPLAAAASFLLVTGTLILMTVWPREVVRQDGEREAPVGDGSPQVVENSGGALDAPSAHDADAPPPPVAPTPYERLVMQAALDRSGGRVDRELLAVRRQLIKQLTSLQQIDEQTGGRVAADLGIPVRDLEAELVHICLALRGPRRERAVELLGRMATSRDSLAALLQLWSQGAYQEQVAPAVARLADARTLAACYAQADASHVRSSLAGALLRRLTRSDGRLLVELLTRSRQPQELLAVVRKENGPFTEAIFAELDGESRAVRYAAARALGALNQPDVSRRLIQHVIVGHRRQEALAGLAASEDPVAMSFVSRARRNAVLATALQSALVQSRTTHSWYGG